MSMNDRANEMLNNWTPETASLIATLKRHKFTIVKGDNGEESFYLSKGRGAMKKFIENLIACDEAHLYVKSPGSPAVRWLYLVFGNSPGELVSDYSVPAFGVDAGADPLDAATEEHYNRWEGRKQPMIRAADLYPDVYPLPYGKTVTLKKPITKVECWNYTLYTSADFPVGTEFVVNNPYDETHTSCTIMAEDGVTCTNGNQGYRFIIPNAVLADATGVFVPLKTRDIVGEIIRRES